MTKWWMIRAGDDNELISNWRKRNIASIGWAKLGDPKQINTKDELMEKANQVYKESKPKTRISWVNQVWRFSTEIKKNDKIITYSKETREYLIGTVTKEHYFDYTQNNPNYPNHINVAWEKEMFSRDLLSQAAKNSLGSTLTVFRVDSWGAEIESVLNAPNDNIKKFDDEENSEDIIIDLISKAKVMVEDKVDHFDPWEMEELIAGVLVAMGYNTEVSDKGPDGGVDVLAYKDAFGFEKPLIKVQVKHRKSSTSAPEIQQLLGANPFEANSLFVSTGGFTKDAIKVAKQNRVKLIDLEDLVDIIMKRYEMIPVEIKAMLPLQRVYLPE